MHSKAQNQPVSTLVSARKVFGAHWFLPLIAVAFSVSGCVGPGSNKPPKSKTVVTKTKHINNETKFSSKEYGVQGSPRITSAKRTRKGGGRYQVGKPYKVRGIWYKPTENPALREVGLASWYGPNFHGRLTANGEIYDQYGISAAHPTMPLPSYAMVTNLENGRRIKVRVNDRGPFARGRVIDLSARAAELLGYTKQGVAKVRVEYAGRARMDGLDEAMLLASYEGPEGPTGYPPGSSSGTMIAMVDTPSAPTAASAINNSFENQTVTFSGAVPVPTARPTLFEGIPLASATGVTDPALINQINEVVYRPVPETTGRVLERVPRPLAYAPGRIDLESLAYRHHAHQDGYENNYALAGVWIEIGRLQDEKARHLLGELVRDAGTLKTDTSTGTVLLKTNENHANQVLRYLHDSGLAGAFIR